MILVALLASTLLLAGDLSRARSPWSQPHGSSRSWWRFYPPEFTGWDLVEVVESLPYKSTWHEEYLALGIADAMFDVSTQPVAVIVPLSGDLLVTGPMARVYAPDIERLEWVAAGGLRREDYIPVLPDVFAEELQRQGRLVHYRRRVIRIAEEPGSHRTRRWPTLRSTGTDVTTFYLMRDPGFERVYVVPATVMSRLARGERP